MRDLRSEDPRDVGLTVKQLEASSINRPRPKANQLLGDRRTQTSDSDHGDVQIPEGVVGDPRGILPTLIEFGVVGASDAYRFLLITCLNQRMAASPSLRITSGTVRLCRIPLRSSAN